MIVLACTGPHPYPATYDSMLNGWPGGGEGRCSLCVPSGQIHHTVMAPFESADTLDFRVAIN